MGRELRKDHRVGCTSGSASASSDVPASWTGVGSGPPPPAYLGQQSEAVSDGVIVHPGRQLQNSMSVQASFEAHSASVRQL